MIISCCIIVKGDEELSKLKEAVKSVIDYVDEVIITTNHKEYSKTKSYCSSSPKLKHFHLPWNDDFAAQRNFCASQVREDADFYIWLDSDDVVINAELLPKIARAAKQKNFDTVFFEYWYGAKFDGKPSLKTFVEQEITHYRERLIKPGSIVWKKRIHETPVPVDTNYKYSEVSYSKEYPIAWLHLGADRDISEEKMAERTARNTRLLEKELEDERKEGEADPRTILYLMKIYAEQENDGVILKKCIEMGKEYLSKSGWDQERALCYQLMSRCLGYLKMHKQAADLLHLALKEYPYNPLLYLHLARAYFNLKEYRQMEHWMKIGMNMDPKEKGTGMNNILELKVLSSELLLEFYLYAKRNVRKAYDSARLLNKVNPTKANQQNEDYLFDLKEMDLATEHTHRLIDYLISIQKENIIPDLIRTLPQEMIKLPFFNKYYNKYKQPRLWKKDEICYFANFGGNHFEKWDGESVNYGIGGSETAVINLAEQWVKNGYKVIVYGDPEKEVMINGVLYLPWHTFNHRDKFNIFIQWRNNSMANKISCKKFLVDLHDVWHYSSYLDKLPAIDRIMVKSKYHRSFGEKIDDDKFNIISNGITEA